MATDGRTAIMVDLCMNGHAWLQCAFDNLAVVDDQIAVALLGVCDLHPQTVRRECAVIANLTAAFAIERCLVQQDGNNVIASRGFGQFVVSTENALHFSIGFF